jgi:hypothetical protein
MTNSSGSSTQISSQDLVEPTPQLDHPHHESDIPPAVSDPSPSSDQKPAPYPSTFSEIVALITSGKPIPGIKDIPPTLLSDQATKPIASKRRKPWEKGDTVEGEGTFGDRRDEIIEQELPSI